MFDTFHGQIIISPIILSRMEAMASDFHQDKSRYTSAVPVDPPAPIASAPPAALPPAY